VQRRAGMPVCPMLPYLDARGLLFALLERPTIKLIPGPGELPEAATTIGSAGCAAFRGYCASGWRPARWGRRDRLPAWK
jgi:hypothetical protein